MSIRNYSALCCEVRDDLLFLSFSFIPLLFWLCRQSGHSDMPASFRQILWCSMSNSRFRFHWPSPSAFQWLRKSQGPTYLWDSHDRWRHLRTQWSSAFILILNFGRGVTRINLSLRGDIVQLHMGLNKHTRTWSFSVSWFTAKGWMKIRDRRDQQIKWADHDGYDHRWKKKDK